MSSEWRRRWLRGWARIQGVTDHLKLWGKSSFWKVLHLCFPTFFLWNIYFHRYSQKLPSVYHTLTFHSFWINFLIHPIFPHPLLFLWISFQYFCLNLFKLYSKPFSEEKIQLCFAVSQSSVCSVNGLRITTEWRPVCCLCWQASKQTITTSDVGGSASCSQGRWDAGWGGAPNLLSNRIQRKVNGGHRELRALTGKLQRLKAGGPWASSTAQ